MLLTVAMVVACGSGSDEGESASRSVGEARSAFLGTSSLGAYTFSLQILPGSSPAEYPVLSAGKVDVEGGAAIRASTYLPSILNTGSGAVTVQLLASVGGISTEGSVSVLSGARVEGSVWSSQDVWVYPGVLRTLSWM